MESRFLGNSGPDPYVRWRRRGGEPRQPQDELKTKMWAWVVDVHSSTHGCGQKWVLFLLYHESWDPHWVPRESWALGRGQHQPHPTAQS